jgi:hypothetical protein
VRVLAGGSGGWVMCFRERRTLDTDVDVVLRLLFSTAVFIRFGERVCDVLSAYDSRAVSRCCPSLADSARVRRRGSDSGRLAGAQNTATCPRDDAHVAARCWRDVQTAFSRAEKRTEGLEVFNWAGHKRCAAWVLLEGLI